MRNPSENLFRLIKSMTGPEKGYFKTMAEKNPNKSVNKYLKLFDLMDAESINKSYDESKIRDQFRGDSFLNNLHVAKNYLYKIVLKSLVQYHSEKSISIKITDLYNRALVLYKKGLHNESQTELSKCKNFIYKNQTYEYLFPVLKLERYLISSLKTRDQNNEYLKNSNEQAQIIEKMSNVNIYTELFGKLFVHYQENQILREKEKTDTLETFFKNPYLESENSAITTESKILFNKIFYNYYLLTSRDKQLYEYSKRMISTIESNPVHKNEFPYEYISVLNSYLTSVTFLKNYKDADETISKLKNISIASPYIEERIFIIIYNFELIKFIQTGNFKEGLKLISDIGKKVNELGEKRKNVKNKFNYSIAYLYFGAGKYEEAIEWLNKIINNGTAEMRQDLLSFAFILNLISHFELGDSDYLFYTVRNTYRHLFKKHKLFKVEKAVISFLRKTPRVITLRELNPYFVELKDTLIKITEDPYERIALDYFDFISWLESKITGKEFAEIVKSKVS